MQGGEIVDVIYIEDSVIRIGSYSDGPILDEPAKHVTEYIITLQILKGKCLTNKYGNS